MKYITKDFEFLALKLNNLREATNLTEIDIKKVNFELVVNFSVDLIRNIWKNKKLGYAFLIAINSLFFVSYLKDMNVLSILSFIIIIYILVSIIVAKKMNLKGKEYE